MIRRDPAIAETPVVIVSADATPGQVKTLIQTGAQAYLTKPLDLRHFLQVLDEHLVRELGSTRAY
jgi:CheY-like chemotaxis protein